MLQKFSSPEKGAALPTISNYLNVFGGFVSVMMRRKILLKERIEMTEVHAALGIVN
jgi:hypothetical protein